MRLGQILEYSRRKPSAIALEELSQLGEVSILLLSAAAARCRFPDVFSPQQEMTANTPLFFSRLLQQECPTRFAQRVIDVKKLPFEVPPQLFGSACVSPCGGVFQETPSWKAVRMCYEQSFVRLISHPEVKTLDDEKSFRQLIMDLKARHRGISQQIAQGLQVGSLSSTHCSETPFIVDQ